ncbi:MAG: elongation factor EF-2 [Candidatus Thermoplasmatota archaeon]|nr:elongation factor EF-2 [Candidatus Thermoplasmatota archaeon]
MGRKEDNVKKAQKLRKQLDRIRNIGIVAHIDHGKTTFSDNLLAGAGMISEDLAGEQLALDYDEQEQARGITINAASASMVHEYEGQEYLINLIDTPGHVDFGGDVTRAMRAVDGGIVVVCAVEGVMPQTETVLRQALREKVKPVLLINKVDRLINELKLDFNEMQAQFVKIINEVNKLIKKMVPDEFREEWKVAVEDGSVIFGSSLHNWAISKPYMEKTGITFKDIYEYCRKKEEKILAKRLPIHEVALDMVIDHLPNPQVAQRYRIPVIWKGDPESKAGKAMINCDSDGPLAIMVTKIIIDPHAGEIAFGRVYGGTIHEGQEVYISGMPKKYRTQQVSIMVGNDRIPVQNVEAGNIAAITGLRDAIAGSTVTDQPEVEPFETIKHISDPVVTVKVEAKRPSDLPKLVKTLRNISKADPSIVVNIDQESGEYLMSGMGELHLEITEYRIVKEQGVDIVTSEPTVIYRETVQGRASKFEGKSPNKHNYIYVEVEPLEEAVQQAIKEGQIPENVKKHSKEVAKMLQEMGMDRDEAKGIFAVKGQNIIADVTKGIQHLFETKELVKQSFEEVMDSGPRANEPVMGVKVRLVDAKLHEDAIHRGPAQIIPAVRNAIYGAMTVAKTTLLEPMQKIYISVPHDLMGEVSKELQQRRATITDMETEGDMTIIHGKAPVAEMFGFASAIRSATGGRVLWNTENMGFEPLPPHLLDEVTAKVRERKGLKPEPWGPEHYMG